MKFGSGGSSAVASKFGSGGSSAVASEFGSGIWIRQYRIGIRFTFSYGATASSRVR